MMTIRRSQFFMAVFSHAGHVLMVQQGQFQEVLHKTSIGAHLWNSDQDHDCQTTETQQQCLKVRIGSQSSTLSTGEKANRGPIHTWEPIFCQRL